MLVVVTCETNPQQAPIACEITTVPHKKSAAIPAQMSAFDSDTVLGEANMWSKLTNCFLQNAMEEVVEEALAPLPAAGVGATGAHGWAPRPLHLLRSKL